MTFASFQLVAYMKREVEEKLKEMNIAVPVRKTSLKTSVQPN